MIHLSNKVPLSVIKTFENISTSPFPCNDCNSHSLLKIFQTALSVRSEISGCFDIGRQLKCLKCSHKTKIKILGLAAKIFLGHSLDPFVDTILLTRIPFQIVTRNLHYVARLLQVPGQKTEEQIEQLFYLLDSLEEQQKELVLSWLCQFPFAKSTEVIESIFRHNSNNLYNGLHLLSPTHLEQFVDFKNAPEGFFNLLRLVSPLLKYESTQKGRYALLVAFHDLLPKKRKAMVSICLDYFPKIQNNKECFVRELGELRNLETHSVLETVKPLLNTNSDGNEIGKIINLLDGVNKEEQHQIVHLIKESGIHTTRLSCIEALMNIPYSRREYLFQLVQKNCKIHHSSTGLSSLLQTIGIHQGEDLPRLFDQLFQHFPKLPRNKLSLISHLLNIVSVIVEDKKVSFLKFCNRLFPYLRTYENVTSLLETLYNLNQHDVRAVDFFLRLYAFEKSSINALNALRNLFKYPPEKRLPILTGIETFYQEQRVSSLSILIEFFGSGEAEECFDLLSLLTIKISPEVFQRLNLTFFLRIPADERPSFLEAFSSISDRLSSSEELEKILDIVSIQTDRNQLCQLIQGFIHPYRQTEIHSILSAIMTIPPDQRVSLVRELLSLIHKEMDSFDCTLLVEKILHTKEKQHHRLFNVLKLILVPGDLQIKRLLHAIHMIQVDVLQETVSRAVDLRAEQSPFHSIPLSTLVLKIIDIPPENYDATIQAARFLIEQFPDIECPEDLFSFADVYLNEEESYPPFLKKVNYLGIEITNSNILSTLFDQLKHIPFEHFRRAHLAAQSLIKDLSIINQVKCLSLLARFKAERLPQLVSDLSYLIGETEDADAFEIIEAYLRSDNKAYVQNRFSIFLSGITKNRPDVVKSLLNIPVKTWLETFPLSQPFLIQSSDIYDKIRVFTTLSQVFPKQRENIVGHLKPLDITINELPPIIIALQKVPNVMRSQLMEDAASLFHCLREEHWPNIIQVLYKIEPSHRKQIISDYQNYFKELPEKEVANCLEKISAVPNEQREALCKFLEDSYESCPNAFTRLEALLILNKIHRSEWNFSLAIIEELSPFTNDLETLFALLSGQSASELLAVGFVQTYCRKSQDPSDQVRFVESYLSIPQENRQQMLANMHQMDCCITFHALKKRIQCLELLKATPPDIIQEIMSSPFWSNRNLYNNHLFDLFALIASFPIKEIKPVLEIALPTIQLLKGKQEELLKLLLNIFKNMPHHERLPYAEVLLAVTQHVKADKYSFIKLCHKLHSFRPSFRTHFLPPVRNVLSTFTTLHERTVFITELEGANLQHLEETVRLVDSRLPVPRENTASLIAVLSSLPSAESHELLNNVLHLIDSLDETSHLPKLIKIMKAVPIEERNEVIALAKLFSKKEKGNIKYLLQNIISIPAEDRSRVADICLNYPFYSEINVSELLPAFNKLIKKGQLALFDKIKGVIKEIRNTEALIKSIPILLEMAEEGRMDLLNHVISGAKEFNNVYPFIKIIHELKKENIPELLEQVSPLLERVDNAAHIEAVLKKLAIIPRKERECLIKHVLQIQSAMLRVDRGKDLHLLLEAVYSLPKDEYDEILELIAYPDRKTAELAALFIQTLARFEQPQRKKIVEAAIPFRKEMSTRDYISLIAAIGDYTEQERELGLDTLLQPVFHYIDNPYTQSHLVLTLSLYSATERKEAITYLRSIIHLMGEGNEETVALNLLIIPPAYRKETADLWCAKKRLTFNSLSTLLQERQDILLESHHYLRNLLEQSIKNKRISFLLAEMVIRHFHDLQLHDEHPLFQQAIEMMAIHGSNEGRMDPYRLFEHLKRLIPKEGLVSFTPLFSQIGTERVAINLEGWRREANKEPFVIGDLPKGLPNNHFESLFRSFNERMNELSIPTRNAIQGYIESCFLATPRKLQEDFLEKQFIRGLFNITGKPDTVIDNVVFYIHAILKYICEQDATLREGKIISDKEEVLFRVACSINECPTGQRDGIVSYYNSLPLAYRARQEIEKMVPEAKVAEVVKRSVQSLLQQTFGNVDYLKLVDPSENGVQYPHKALFFMNRLYKQVGLEHRLTFDANSTIIPDYLLDISVKEYLKAFFTLCTPERLIQVLQRDIADALNDKSIKYMDLMYTLEHMNVNLESSLILDSRHFPVGVTQEGALAILLYNEALIKK